MPLKSSHFYNVVVRYWCAHVPWSVSVVVVVRQQPDAANPHSQYSVDHAGGRTRALLLMCLMIALARN